MPLAQAAPRAVEAPEHKAFFVAPTLTNVWQSEARSSVILVSARGAVGKSTFAGELASRTGAHLWPLGKFQVGHQFLEGALVHAYGDESYSQVARELREGNRLVVLDGLDEARLHAGIRNFDAFLDSLVVRLRDAGERPSLLVLGRPLSASYTANRLFDGGVNFEWYEIDYFDRGPAERFIENYLDDGRYKPHRQQRGNFENARNTLFDWLEKGVPEEVDPKSLTGYAPVLLFIAELLDVGNPYAQVQQLERESERALPAAPLAKIALGLQTRDTTKVLDDIKDVALKKAYTDANVWSPEEQSIRFLAKKANYELEARPPKGLPGNLRAEYEENVERWLGDYPFNDHPLFEDYVYAWLLSHNAVEGGLAEAVRGYLRSERAGYRPTPLLLWFVGHANAKDSSSERVSIDAADFGFVYESVLSDAGSASGTDFGSSKPSYPRLILSSQDPGRPLVGEIRFPAPIGAGEKTGGRKVRLDLQNSASGLWFWRNLLVADIAVAGTVRIGSDGADFVLGPGVDLECEAFACDAATVRVSTPSESEGVVLLAKRYVGDAVPELSSWSEMHLRVGWDNLRYPWNGFPPPETRGPHVTAETREAFLKLRRLLMLFQARGHGDLARSIDLIENPAFAGSGLARRLLSYCVEGGLIRKDGTFYELSREELDRRGISWEDLQGHRISSSIALFLDDFLERGGRPRSRSRPRRR
jgi:hypothetical protein